MSFVKDSVITFYDHTQGYVFKFCSTVWKDMPLKGKEKTRKEGVEGERWVFNINLSTNGGISFKKNWKELIVIIPSPPFSHLHLISKWQSLIPLFLFPFFPSKFFLSYQRIKKTRNKKLEIQIQSGKTYNFPKLHTFFGQIKIKSMYS